MVLSVLVILVVSPVLVVAEDGGDRGAAQHGLGQQLVGGDALGVAIEGGLAVEHAREQVAIPVVAPTLSIAGAVGDGQQAPLHVVGDELGGGDPADRRGEGGGPVGGIVGVAVAVGQGRADAHRPAECGRDQAARAVVAGAGGHGVGQAGRDRRVGGVVAEGAGVGRAAGEALALRRQPALIVQDPRHREGGGEGALHDLPPRRVVAVGRHQGGGGVGGVDRARGPVRRVDRLGDDVHRARPARRCRSQPGRLSGRPIIATVLSEPSMTNSLRRERHRAPKTAGCSRGALPKPERRSSAACSAASLWRNRARTTG